MAEKDSRRAVVLDLDDPTQLIALMHFTRAPSGSSALVDAEFRVMDGFTPTLDDKAAFVIALRGIADSIELDIEMDEGLIPK